MPEVVKAETSGVKAANEEWFLSTGDVTSGVSPDYGPLFMLTFAMDTSSAVEISLDSGATFVAIRDEVGNATFDANTYYSRPVIVRSVDQFTVRATAGVTLHFARLDEWS